MKVEFYVREPSRVTSATDPTFLGVTFMPAPRVGDRVNLSYKKEGGGQVIFNGRVVEVEFEVSLNNYWGGDIDDAVVAVIVERAKNV